MSNTVPSLKQLFLQRFNTTITKRIADNIVRWKTLYETRDNNIEALNSPLLGCTKMHFFAKDQQELFDIMMIDKTEFTKVIAMSSVPNEFKVASDAFNLLTIWSVHLIEKSTLSKSLKESAIDALTMMQFKFFTSLVGHWFPYGAKQDVMEATIDQLSDKFDIKHKETSTWKLIMEHRSKDVLSKNSIHNHAIGMYSPDNKVTYIITDMQTRLRTKIKLIVREYHRLDKEGIKIASTNMTTNDAEGEKILKELGQSFDNMIAIISNKALNTNQFIRADYIKILSKMISNVRPDMLRTLLTQFSSRAMYQNQKQKQDAIDKSGKYFEGYRILISNIIQRTYRACIIDKVNMKSRLAILEKAKNMYRSSRIADPVVLQVKESVDKIVEDSRISNRDATNASLKIAFILYIILLTFDYE